MKNQKNSIVRLPILVFSIVILGIYSAFAASAEEGASQRISFADGIIVKWRADRSGVALNARIEAANILARNRAVSLRYGRAGALGIHVLKLDRALPLAQAEGLAREIAANDPEIEYAEADQVMHSMFTPNDTLYSQQWHYFETTAGINLPAAWDVSTGSGVTVAVLDTGYRPHADFGANLLPGYDFITDSARANDGGGRDSDAQDPGDWSVANQCEPGWPGYNSSWHGTHVLGTLAAATNNGSGVAGVAFNAGVVPVRVLGVCGGALSDIADAIVWASGGSVSGVPANPYPARVLNLSLGGLNSCGSTYQNAIDSARSRNSVVVVSAGNSNANASNYRPGNCSGVITVAAVNRSGGKASYSNYGSVVEIAAPGGETTSTVSDGVLSSLNTGSTTPSSDSFSFYQGTSMAAPHVAGVAALLLSVNNSLPPDGIGGLLQLTARSFPGTCSQCGSGIVDASAAIGGLSTYVDSPVMTEGHGNGSYYLQKGFKAYGFPTFGSMSPVTLNGGQTVKSLMDGSVLGSELQIAGFPTNPGQNWLISVTARGVTKTGTSATSFSYNSSTDTATWSWATSGGGGSSPFGFSGSGTTPITIVHE